MNAAQAHNKFLKSFEHQRYLPQEIIQKYPQTRPDHISVLITKLQIHISTENITFPALLAFEKACTLEHHSIPSSPQVEAPFFTSLHKV